MKPTRSGPARRLPHLLGATMIAAMLLSPFQPLVALAGTPSPRQAAALQEEPPMPTDIPVTTTSGGLTVALSEGSPQEQAPVTSTVAAGEPLSAEETAVLLGRLPALEEQAADVQEFRLPPEPLPPPPPQTIITTTFPATQTAAAPEPVSGPLLVERYAPEGEIAIAPFLQVTFNQPMVPLGTLEELNAADVPVKLTPEIPGVWKWLGTQTLTFEYRGGDVDRFPMATEYTAEVPAGTTSATGGMLEEAVTWTFRTPAPTVVASWPAFGPQRRDALLFLAFDQLIDPAAVLETVRVTAGGQEYPVRLAAQEEVAADPTVADMAKRAGEGRWLAFRAEQEFPADATVNVNAGPGTPSAEGPLTTEDVQSFSFQTFAPLRITRAECAWGGTRCQPGTPFAIIFNNPLDAEAFDPAWVTVAPEIPGMIVEVFGSTLQVRGATAGRSTYEVTVAGEVKDVFGQPLGQPRTLDFHTDVAYPTLSGPFQPLVTLDPADPTPTFNVFSVNYPELHLRIYRVTPQDWPEWQQYLQNYWQETPPTPPGELVVDQLVPVQGETDQMVETAIGLQTALGGASTGHLIVIVDIPPQAGRERDRTSVQSWVQATQIGLDAVSDHESLLAWATRLTDGAPLEGVAVDLLDSGKQGVTNADGTLRLDLPDAPYNLLAATLGDDTAILPSSAYDYYGNSGWRKSTPQDELRWYVFDDRQMYRPNEEVHLKGWLRRIGMTQAGDVTLGDGLPTTVQYQVSDPLGNPIADGVAEVNDLGGFDFSFTLAENVNLGYANIYLRANGATGNLSNQETYYSFQIQEFRRPEFEVKAQPEGEGPYFLGDDAVVSVSAQYYAGGPLPAAETTWNVSASPASYSPPNWDEFVFGEWIPWWHGPFFAEEVYFSDVVAFGPQGPGTGEQANTFTSATDPSGRHYLRMGFVRSDAPRPYTVSAQATVMDVNRQAWSSTTSLLVHPAELYVGLRSASTFVEQGDPLEIDVIVTDVDGNAVAERSVTLHAARLDYKYEQGEWKEVESDPQTCEIVSGNEPETCTFTTELGGEYRITAEVRDDRERLNRTVLTRWVSGGTARPSRNVEQETAELIPDKESYAPGDVAEILVVSPFTPAEGLLTVARSGIITTERFAVENGTATLRIPIEEAHIPNLSVQVDINGSAPRLDDKGEPLPDAPPRPAYATGSLSLPVPPRSRALTLEVTPEATSLAPGAQTAIDLRATDAEGNPVENAELAVIVVDEAILALTGYTVPDPLAAFYTERWAGVDSAYTRASIVLANPADMAQAIAGGRGGGGSDAIMAAAAPAAAEAPMEEAAAMPMPTAAADMAFGEAEKVETAATPIAVRSDFNPLALFTPAVRTDADGRARVEFTLPDNLTRYRVTVVAATEKQFGKAESNVTARLPLMVRPSAPRFLNFGDEFQLPIVVQNQTDAPLSVQVAVTATNLLLPAGNGQRVEIPANDRVEVRFPAATENAGTARFQVAVSAGGAAGDFADAASGELPVYTPATTEAFATYGIVDEGAVAQPLATPENVFPQFGGLEVSTSSTALSALTDALIYLVHYPFECSEQIASRIIGITALRDVLTAFQAPGLPPAEELNAFVQADIERLEGMQNLDGGFPIWERGRESVPFYSIHGAHALARARLKDYPVSDDAIGRALDYLRNIENYYPSYYSETTKRTLSAYALFVRDLLGDTDMAEARALLAQQPIEEWSLEALAWLWQVLGNDPSAAAEVEAIRSHLNNQVVETPSTANFFTSYGDDAYLLLHSNRRTDAIILDAYINQDAENSLIPKLVNGLLAGSSNGRWNNTQENVFVLLALDNYFNTYESVTPDFVARVWLGETYVAESTFQGYSDETYSTLVPMDFLVQQEGAQNVIVAKEGDGRLYYRLGLKYAPTDLQLDPLDMGFVVQRTYQAVDDPADVQRDADGVWRIKAGAKVRVALTMVARNRRYHVALTDPLPAGLEAINPALAVSEDVPSSPAAQPYGWWWYSTWYEHQNLRDQRAEAFTTLLWDGVYTYEYVARATTPGEFIVPPARAEEMYSPEVFGRSASDRVIVE